jgi:Methyltransferase domain
MRCVPDTARIVSHARRVARAARHPRASARALAARIAADGRPRDVQWRPSGHFYSPYPDMADYERRAPGLLDRDRDVVGVDLHVDEQLALVDAVVDELDGSIDLSEHPVPGEKRRYWLDNFAYAHGDGVVLHGMLRHLQPRRIVEVGSGFSSALILDTVDEWLPGAEVTFVEPHPELLEDLLRPGDEEGVTIHRAPVQDVDPAVFAGLRRGDVLFIDSTHVCKPGSDVNHLFFEVLPRLPLGVWVHLHDIFFPFEYPDAWVREGRAWHEVYLLRAFLSFNRAFEVRWFQDYLWSCQRAALTRLPWVEKNPGGNLWLERVA